MFWEVERQGEWGINAYRATSDYVSLPGAPSKTIDFYYIHGIKLITLMAEVSQCIIGSAIKIRREK